MGQQRQIARNQTENTENQTENRERLGCGSAYTHNKTGLESAAAFSYWPCRPSGLPVL